MSLPEQIPTRYSDDSADYVSMSPVVEQIFRRGELIEMIVSVVGKDPTRIQQVLQTGAVVYNGYRYTWDSLTADLSEIAPILALIPDDDPARAFVPSEASAVQLESGGGTQRSVIELDRHDASGKKLFGRASPWDLLLQFAASDTPRYEKYSHARHADLFRLTLSYEHGQRLLAGLLDAAPRVLRHRWSALRPPTAITFVCPR
jgi:hypothetical protein